MRWISLRRLGQIRVLRSSYFFFIAVPIVARMLDGVGPHHTISIMGATLRISLELPFSWKVFYFSSLFFVISTSIYFLRCPTLVRAFQNFSEFRDQGYGQGELKGGLIELLEVIPPEKVKEVLPFFFERFGKVGTSLPDIGKLDRNAITSEIIRLDLDDSRSSEAFALIRSALSWAHPFSRRITFVCYMVGFALLSIVLVQNVVYVVRVSF